jgi:hypothetical protein
MAKIDILETAAVELPGPGKPTGAARSPSSKSPSPARRDAGGKQASPGGSGESGYFDDEEVEEVGEMRQNSEVREDSIEIIFDKNATNNNTGQRAVDGGKTGRNSAAVEVGP